MNSDFGAILSGLDCASSVVLFGSRAAGVADASSDWDLLCVGERVEAVTSASVVWLSPTELTSPQWLGSELAGHIAHYGVCLRGDDRWRRDVAVGTAAIARKRQRVLGRLAALERRRYGQRTERQLGTRLRRELQRYQQLLIGEAIAPRPILDAAWQVRLADTLVVQPGLEGHEEALLRAILPACE